MLLLLFSPFCLPSVAARWNRWCVRMEDSDKHCLHPSEPPKAQTRTRPDHLGGTLLLPQLCSCSSVFTKWKEHWEWCWSQASLTSHSICCTVFDKELDTFMWKHPQVSLCCKWALPSLLTFVFLQCTVANILVGHYLWTTSLQMQRPNTYYESLALA